MVKFFTFAALVAACSISAAQEPPAEQQSIGDCFWAMWLDDRASLAKTRLGIGIDPIPLALRASKEKASIKEKASLSFVAEQARRCQTMDLPRRERTMSPDGQRIVGDLDRGFHSVLAKLYSGDLTWGGGIEAMEVNSNEFARKANEYNASLERAAALAKAAQAEQERQRVSAALDAEQARQRAERAADMQRQQMEYARRQQEQQNVMNGLMMLEAARPRNGINCISNNIGGTGIMNCR